jgi:hypothetical protein
MKQRQQDSATPATPKLLVVPEERDANSCQASACACRCRPVADGRGRASHEKRDRRERIGSGVHFTDTRRAKLADSEDPLRDRDCGRPDSLWRAGGREIVLPLRRRASCNGGPGKGMSMVQFSLGAFIRDLIGKPWTDRTVGSAAAERLAAPVKDGAEGHEPATGLRARSWLHQRHCRSVSRWHRQPRMFHPNGYSPATKSPKGLPMR